MILHAKDRITPVSHALKRAIVEINVRRLQVAWQLFEIYHEPVILRRNFDALCLPI